MTPSKSLKPYTLHPTPHTLPPGKTFCRKPYLSLNFVDGFRIIETEVIFVKLDTSCS
ncbi:MAG: hypothetical protein PX636_00740 [Microcystis sp. M53598_WE2]|nr:hypothetical protein [Microcystis sp. M53598_WE2]